MKKITIGISLILPLISKAQLHISANVELYTLETIILYSVESFSNAYQLNITAGTTDTLNGGGTAWGIQTNKGTSSSNLSIRRTSKIGSYNVDQTTLGTT
jgi:hypothetical protein